MILAYVLIIWVNSQPNLLEKQWYFKTEEACMIAGSMWFHQGTDPDWGDIFSDNSYACVAIPKNVGVK